MGSEKAPGIALNPCGVDQDLYEVHVQLMLLLYAVYGVTWTPCVIHNDSHGPRMECMGLIMKAIWSPHG
eukprot:8221018-Karenia_brevis.AAC.1